jgi:hypothetical protein
MAGKVENEGADMEADEFPLGKVMWWVGGVGIGLTLAAIVFVWFGFD